MTFKKASKLHNGDQVIRKYDGEILTVVSATIIEQGNALKEHGCKDYVWISAIDSRNCERGIHHTGVK